MKEKSLGGACVGQGGEESGDLNFKCDQVLRVGDAGLTDRSVTLLKSSP